MAQISIPTGDYIDGLWKNTINDNINLYSYIDNNIPGDNNANIKNTDSASIALMYLSGLSTPSAGDHTIKFVVGGQGFAGTVDIQILLSGAGGIIASVTTGAPAATTIPWSTGSYTLSAGEVSSISDYSLLYIGVSGAPQAGNVPYVSEIEFQIPDSGGGGGGGGGGNTETDIFMIKGCNITLGGVISI